MDPEIIETVMLYVEMDEEEPGFSSWFETMWCLRRLARLHKKAVEDEQTDDISGDPVSPVPPE